MIIYLCIKNKSNTLLFSEDMGQKPFFLHTDGTMKLKKGHISHNNQWTLPEIELDLYFMIIQILDNPDGL